ncbi:ABC transporter substrate-binding protein [Halobacteriovorax sp. XZX-3]|uniref:ABC transporter substrate-binding protein n=1 Tax=unclassified Halobacteriovorax TaxID=2639665 RepID=UPI003710EB18
MLKSLMATLIMAALVVSCSGKSSANKSTFVYCSEGSPSGFNPQFLTDGPSHNAAVYPLYNRLVKFETGSTNIIPSIAESWTISEDQLTYTFNIRKDIKFHTTKDFKPTRNLDASDIVWSFNRMFDKNHPYHKVSGGIYEYWDGMGMSNIIKSINQTDKHQLQITLHHPEAPLLANFAMAFTSILSREYGEKMLAAKTPEVLDRNPVGTGPFIFKSYQKDTMIRYEANKEYFNGVPKVKRMVFSITPDPSVRTQKLVAGECHLATQPAPTDIAALDANKDITVLSGPGLNVGYLALNTQKRPFDNIHVRRAINYALNRKTYVEPIYLGYATVAKNPMPPTIWGYNNDIKDYDYNVEMAKEELKKAGLPDGFSTTLWTLPVSRPYNPNGKKMGELMQEDLAKVGIKVELVTYDWPTYLKKAHAGEHAMLQMGWTGDNGDPDNFLYMLLSCEGAKAGSNYANWCNKEYDSEVIAAKRLSDKKERAVHYMKAQEVFKKEVPWITLFHSTVHRAMRSNVKGFKIHPLGNDIFDKVSLE